MLKRFARITTAITILITLMLLANSAYATDPAPGSPNIGDPYYPGAGNGGYDVLHYTLDIAVNMETNIIDATATKDLSGEGLVDFFRAWLFADEMPPISELGLD